MQVAGPSQLTGEHRGVEAEWPEPSALLWGHLLSIAAKEKQTKQSQVGRVRTGRKEDTPLNRSLHPQRIQLSWHLGWQRVGCPGP